MSHVKNYKQCLSLKRITFDRQKCDNNNRTILLTEVLVVLFKIGLAIIDYTKRLYYLLFSYLADTVITE
jgi:hypothetical protein